MTLFGGLIIVLVIIFGISQALKMGEKSPILVSGTVHLDEAYAANANGIYTLYLVLYDMDSPMPMPYGAVKEKLEVAATAGKFYDFYITKEKIITMRPDAPVPLNLRIKARLDKDGVAGRDQPGDITGEISGIKTGTTGVTLNIDKLITDS